MDTNHVILRALLLDYCHRLLILGMFYLGPSKPSKPQSHKIVEIYTLHLDKTQMMINHVILHA